MRQQITIIRTMLSPKVDEVTLSAKANLDGVIIKCKTQAVVTMVAIKAGMIEYIIKQNTTIVETIVITLMTPNIFNRR